MSFAIGKCWRPRPRGRAARLLRLRWLQVALNVVLCASVWVGGGSVSAQVTSATAPAAAMSSLPLAATDTSTAPHYKLIRYLEDYSYLANVAQPDTWSRVKYVPLWPGGYLSFGGQHRLRYELTDPTDLGVGEAGVGAVELRSVLLSRNLFHADLWLQPYLRVFTQLGGFYALGAPASQVAPPDADDLDVTQLFVEASGRLLQVHVALRVGRQEMSLGSTRWVSVRDGTNVRQAFDLIRLSMEQQDRWSLEMFLGTTPELRRGPFDDAPNRRDAFWGSYGTVRLWPQLMNLEVFYLGRRRHAVEHADVTAREVRHTFGLRLHGKTAFGSEYSEHALLQLGSFDAGSVLAWAFASALWQQLPAALSSFRIGVRGDALSGDGRPGDRVVRTFYPLFPNQTFFSALPAIYPANLYDVHPLLRYAADKLALEAGCVFFWRQAVADAVYAPPGVALISGSQTHARYTGAQLSLSLSYQSDAHLSFNAEYSHVFPGRAIAAAGGAAVDFFGTWTTYTY